MPLMRFSRQRLWVTHAVPITLSAVVSNRRITQGMSCQFTVCKGENEACSKTDKNNHNSLLMSRVG